MDEAINIWMFTESRTHKRSNSIALTHWDKLSHEHAYIHSIHIQLVVNNSGSEDCAGKWTLTSWRAQLCFYAFTCVTPPSTNSYLIVMFRFKACGILLSVLCWQLDTTSCVSFMSTSNVSHPRKLSTYEDVSKYDTHLSHHLSGWEPWVTHPWKECSAGTEIIITFIGHFFMTWLSIH